MTGLLVNPHDSAQWLIYVILKMIFGVFCNFLAYFCVIVVNVGTHPSCMFQPPKDFIKYINVYQMLKKGLDGQNIVQLYMCQ